MKKPKCPWVGELRINLYRGEVDVTFYQIVSNAGFVASGMTKKKAATIKYATDKTYPPAKKGRKKMN
jgi:hypothetical protein